MASLLEIECRMREAAGKAGRRRSEHEIARHERERIEVAHSSQRRHIARPLATELWFRQLSAKAPPMVSPLNRNQKDSSACPPAVSGNPRARIHCCRSF